MAVRSGLRSRPVDVGKLLQENAGVVGIVGAVVGFIASQFVQIWRDHQAEQRAIARERRADKRAQRDAKLAQMRTAFQPALLAAWVIQMAAMDMVRGLTTNRGALADLLEGAKKGLNEARAQLFTESDVRDVFDEFERVRIAYANLSLNVLDPAGRAPSEVIDAHWSVIVAGGMKIEQLIDDHLRAVERSAV